MLDVKHLIESGGLLLIGFMVFAESGLLIGIFLPGDTLLFTAGLFASQGKLPLVWLLLVVMAGAVIGDNVGYSIGHQAGKRLFKKMDSLFFRPEHLQRAEAFYERHGGKTIIFARFVPVIRTFAPMVAGASRMPRKRFMAFNLVGGVLWGAGITMLGVWLGKTVPNIDKYILPIVILAGVFTFGPVAYEVFGNSKIRTALWQRIKKTISRK